jgi:hypothetical protein
MSHKTLSNLLSRSGLARFGGGRQGRSRRLDTEAVRLIDLSASLALIGVSPTEAFAMGAALLDGRRPAPDLPTFLTVHYDRSAHRIDLDARLREAAERVITPRRGRPAGSSAAREKRVLRSRT